MNTENKKGFQSLGTLINSSDLDWIQTSNLLSRNQVRYSVAPRGLLFFAAHIYDVIAGAKIEINV